MRNDANERRTCGITLLAQGQAYGLSRETRGNRSRRSFAPLFRKVAYGSPED
jgi:hypothetical protein